MKKAKSKPPGLPEKTPGTRIVEKYRPQMNKLSEAERKQLLQEGLGLMYQEGAADHAHRG